VGALGLYHRLGFVRTEKMAKYYLNGGDAFKLKLVVDPQLLPPEDGAAEYADQHS
jgi:N-alpha-acetyltransferase 30